MFRALTHLSSKRGFSSSRSSLNRGKSRTPISLTPNQQIHGFTLQSTHDFPDFNLRLFCLEHDRLKSRYLHFESEDMNNSFAVQFRTLPVNNKGVPHILEHTVLCGSKKFPVRDPFFAMLKRSLNSYMNAWTGPDLTMYPFSTTNQKDFKNLLRVYSDAVFQANLRLEDFLQEGWRLEYEENQLQFKGVVFNEMKGEMEGQNSFFYESLSKQLFAGSEYAFNFGGDPSDIPKLSHEELRSFYQKYYHPSNCVFVSYGDLDVKPTLQFLNDEYLSKIDPTNTHFFPGKLNIESPIKAVVYGPADPVCLDSKSNSQFGISFVCDQAFNDPFDYIGLELLSSVLFDFPNSPFYQEFIASQNATDFCAANGFSEQIFYPIFTMGLKNVSNSPEVIEELKKRSIGLLTHLVENGFDSEFIESILHSLELKSRLSKSNFGISLFGELATAFNYNNLDYIKLQLNMEETMANLRHKVNKEKYLQFLIQKYLLSNPKKLDLTLLPDPKFSDKIKMAEKKTLTELKSNMSDSEIETIKKQTILFTKHQNAECDFDILPKLEISDIPVEFPLWEKKHIKFSGVPITYVSEFTNKTTHFRLKLDIKDLSSSLVPYLSILEEFINQLGTKNHDYKSWNTKMNLHTNNLKMSSCSTSNIETGNLEFFILLEISCLDRNIEQMFQLLAEILSEVDFSDNVLLAQLITKHGYEAGNSFSNEALQLALSVAKGGITAADKLVNAYDLVN